MTHAPATTSRRTPRAAALCVLVLLALLALGCNRKSHSNDATAAPSATTGQASAGAAPPRSAGSPRPTASTTPAAETTADAATVASMAPLRDLVQRYGEPPNAGFARLRIPSLGLDAPVGSALVGSDGVMTAPHDPVAATWYDLTLWPGMGGAPGAGGNAIFSGHVNYAYDVAYADGAYYRGPAVFANLTSLTPGDGIEVDYQGKHLRYRVTWVRELPQSLNDWGPIWSRDVPVDSITLYTCTGTFDSATRDYSHRFVVRAERVS